MIESYRLLVTGSRTWGDTVGSKGESRSVGFTEKLTLTAMLDGLQLKSHPEVNDLTIVHGGCPTGADKIAATWAAELGVPTEVFGADWNTHGHAAGPIRNAQMVETMDPGNPTHLVVAAWDGKSRGTKSTIDLALKRGLQIVRLQVR